MKALFERAAVPLATPGTKGAWLGGRRLVAIDATSFDVAISKLPQQIPRYTCRLSLPRVVSRY